MLGYLLLVPARFRRPVVFRYRDGRENAQAEILDGQTKT
jgi:hypothetical protein